MNNFTVNEGKCWMGMLEQKKMIPPIATKKELEEASRPLKRMIGGITGYKYSTSEGQFSTICWKEIDAMFCSILMFRYL